MELLRKRNEFKEFLRNREPSLELVARSLEHGVLMVDHNFCQRYRHLWFIILNIVLRKCYSGLLLNGLQKNKTKFRFGCSGSLRYVFYPWHAAQCLRKDIVISLNSWISILEPGHCLLITMWNLSQNKGSFKGPSAKYIHIHLSFCTIQLSETDHIQKRAVRIVLGRR